MSIPSSSLTNCVNYMTMRELAIGLLFFFLAGMPMTVIGQGWQWLSNLGGPMGDDLNGLSVESSGSSWVSGTFRGTVTKDGYTVTSIGDRDVYLGKLDNSGVLEWLIRAGSTDDDSNGGVATDDQGNAYIAGRYWDEADFGNLTITRNQGSNSAIYLAKYNDTGSASWAKSIDGGGLKVVNDMVCDAEGNIILIGYFSDTLFIDNEILVAESNSNVFTIKFDPLGNLEWAGRTGSLRDVRGSSVGVDPSGNVYVGGSFEGALVFADETLSTATIDNDVFLLKYDAEGNELWAIRGGGVHSDNCNAIAVNPAGDIFLTGNFIGVLKFDSEEVQSPGFNEHLFITKINSEGGVEWSRAYGGTDDEYGQSIAVDPTRIIVGGYFRGISDLDGTVLVADPIVTDGFVGVFDLQGNLQQGDQLSGEDFGLGVECAIFPSGDIAFAGIFENAAALDDQDVTSSGGYDGFIGRYSTTTSVETIQPFDLDLIIFPNPASEYLVIHSHENGILESIQLEIIDKTGSLAGTALFGPPHSGESQIIDIKFLPVGAYFLKITINNKSIVLPFLKF